MYLPITRSCRNIFRPLSSNSRYKFKNDADEAVSVVSLTSSSGGYINGRNSALFVHFVICSLSVFRTIIFFSSTYFFHTEIRYRVNNDDSGQLSTTIYDKRDNFNFKIINFLNMCSNIPASPAYGGHKF
jgi:hypothetical protein